MKILIRTDIGGPHGLGHAVRCRALARALAAQGAEVRFLTQTTGLLEFMAPMLVDYFVETNSPAFHPQMEWCDTIIVDNKLTNLAWYQWLRQRGKPLVMIDRIEVSPDFCDMLIAPASHWAPDVVSRLRAGFGDRFLYGWDYVMLDEEVTSQAPVPYEQRQDGPIVFCAGGSDLTGALEKMYQWTRHISVGALLLYCYGTQSQEAKTTSRQPPTGAYVLGRVPFSRAYLREAALVVGLFGVTPYECLWYQTPMLIVGRTVADAADAFNLCLASDWATRYISSIDSMDATHFTTTLTGFWQDTDTRRRMHAASAGLLDGGGVVRVADTILAL